MNRNLGIERVYSLGDYKTLRVIDHIENLPEDLALDVEFIRSLRKLQLLTADIAYQDYWMLNNRELSKLVDGEERRSALIELQANTMDELYKLLKKE